MKNKKIWRMIKKIFRTICIWGIIAVMIVPAFAVEDMETVPLHPYMTMSWNSETTNWCYYIVGDNPTLNVAGEATDVKYRAIFGYQSALEKNTFYHIRAEFKANNQAGRTWIDNHATGMITQQGGDVETLMFPANSLSQYLQQMNTTPKGVIYWSYDDAMNYKIRSYVGAKVYYYFTKTSINTFTVDAVMYFNDEFFDYGWSFEASATRYMQCYLGIVFPAAGDLQTINYDVYPVGGNDYNGKLDQIIALLQAQGGGLTEEDIKRATVEALRQHEEEERQQAQQGTQDAQQQAEQAMARYTAVMEQMKTAMAGIEDIKNIDTSTYTLTIGPFTNPMTGGSFPAVGVDFYTAYQSMPAVLKSTCPIVVTFFVLMAYAREFLDIFRHVEKTMHGEDE